MGELADQNTTANQLRHVCEQLDRIRDAVGVDPGTDVADLIDAVKASNAELLSWRSGIRRKGFKPVDSVPGVIATAAALARQSWDEEADHGELMRSAAATMKALSDASCGLLAERDVLRWLHAEAAFERDQLQDAADDLRQQLMDERGVALAEVDRLRREVEFEARAWNWRVDEAIGGDPKVRACACISDTQAATLGPGFSRPVCAVHPELLPDEWQKRLGVLVLDPDGWRNDRKSWGEPISEQEFRERAAISTSDWSASGTPWAEGGEPE